MTTVHVYQSIHIQSLRVNTVANSSVLQIGTAGAVKSLSNNYNTGGYSGPAPSAAAPAQGPGSMLATPSAGLVPLSY